MTEKRTGSKAGKVRVRGPEKVSIKLRVNGKEYELHVEPRRTLLDALRKDLGLTGTKKGCDEGTCGACTVLIDGRAIYSCMTLALACEGKSIETIEGLEKNGQLDPIQKAFIAEDALQCGFCTPGQVMAVKALLDSNPGPSLQEVKSSLAGSICRCGAYPKIFRAALRAAEERRRGA